MEWAGVAILSEICMFLQKWVKTFVILCYFAEAWPFNKHTTPHEYILLITSPRYPDLLSPLRPGAPSLRPPEVGFRVEAAGRMVEDGWRRRWQRHLLLLRR